MGGGGPTSSRDLLGRRALLDEALIGLRAIKDPNVPVRAIERNLRASLRALYGALASPSDAKQYNEGTATALNRALAALGSLEAMVTRDTGARRVTRNLREATQDWREAVGRTLLHPLQLPRPAEGEWPRALTGVPSLLTLERGPVPPAIVLPIEEEAPEIDVSMDPTPTERWMPVLSLEELLAQAEAAGEELGASGKKAPASRPARKKARPAVTPKEVEEAQFGLQLPRSEVEFARARAFFEELAMMSVMRQPDAGDLWSELSTVEERLLARVDGIVACGVDVLPELVKLLDDRPVPDPELTWAALFVHGCLAGDDALHQVARTVRTVGLEEPEIFDATADALAFVPHPGLESLLRGWLSGPEPTLQLLAVRVLGRRGMLRGEEALNFALDEDPKMALEGARALPWASGALDLGEMAELLRSEEEELVSFVIETFWLRHPETGVEQVRALVAEGQEGFASAALWLAIGGGPEAAADFEAALARGGKASPALLEALGWYGDLRFVEPLLAQLRAGQVAAVGALQRLTGASLTDDVPDPEYEKGEEPFVRGFSPPPQELELTADPESWTAWWRKHQERATLKKRYRWGHLWSPQDNLWEMEHAPASMRERRLAFHELVARTGATHPFDPRDFVARQQAMLARWREAPELRRAASGTWALSFSR